jgi:hypothetical protein
MISECSTEELELALAGELPTGREEALQRHLEECEACSAALEQMAGGKAWCEEAAGLLADDELDDAVGSREEWSDIDFTVVHLEPSDAPNVLGRLGNYDVLEIIGRGGMGVVLKGFEDELNRYVAIKVLAPHLAQSSLARSRFTREARAAAAVVHPHVMAIHCVQPSGRLPFLVMPLVAGESLAQRLRAEGRLELKETLRIGMQAAAGLSAAHEQGLVHRDVKPANILLEKGVERAVLTDFGLARAADDVSMTRWGVIAGTPQYMSPEQARGEPLDGRSDLFSLGCVLYEMATGVSPFRADSTLATLRRLIDDPPPAMAALNAELPPWFIAIVDRLLEKDPAGRFASAKQVSELLEGCLAHLQQPANVPLPAGLPAPVARPNSRLRKILFKGVIVMIAALGIGLVGMLLMQATEPPDIAGNWSGEGWGQVALHAAGRSEYAGSYLATESKQPGKIDVRWSRIERRFNGTWSEGKDRFGKISIRLVDHEIRGAWTTDAAAKLNPKTPDLADLAWTRAATAADSSRGSPYANPPQYILPGVPGMAGNRINVLDSARGAAAMTFGPVVERVVDGAIDFESGRIVKEVPKSVSDAKDFNTHVEEVIAWMERTETDAVCESNHSWREVGMKSKPVDNGVWDRFTPEQLAAPLDSVEKEKWQEEGLDNRFPKTYAIQTRKGAMGLLQILGFTENPTGAKIRYKLLKQPDSAVQRYSVIKSGERKGVVFQDNKGNQIFADRIEFQASGNPTRPSDLTNRDRYSSTNTLAFFCQGKPRASLQGWEQGWKVEKGCLLNTGSDARIVTKTRFGREDAIVFASLTFDSLQGSGAIFTFGDGNVFELDPPNHEFAANGLTLVRGRISSPAIVITPGKEFQFQVEHYGKLLDFLIDGKLIQTVEFAGDLGQVGFMPKKATLRIRAFGGSQMWPQPQSTDSSSKAGLTPASVTRTFPLRFKLASEMAEDLRQILLGRSGNEAKPSANNREITVTTSAETMKRIQTFITVMDWPDGITRQRNYEYPRDTTLRAARSFFYACAIEDADEVFSRLLSPQVLAELKGDTKSEQYEKYLFGGVPDAAWEKSLRADWPGKKEAIRRFVSEWNRYPLIRITEEAGVAIGFGEKHFCSVSFDGAPKDFYSVTIEPGRADRGKASFFFSSLPPWWERNPAKRR